jgi:hypothetical protein
VAPSVGGPAEEAATARHGGRPLALGVVIAVMFLTFLDNTIVSVALGSVQSDVRAGVTALQWVVSAYALTFASGMLGFGMAGDEFGRKRVMLAVIGIFCAGSVLSALAPNVAVLIAGRAVMGLGAAASEPGIRPCRSDRADLAAGCISALKLLRRRGVPGDADEAAFIGTNPMKVTFIGSKLNPCPACRWSGCAGCPGWQRPARQRPARWWPARWRGARWRGARWPVPAGTRRGPVRQVPGTSPARR